MPNGVSLYICRILDHLPAGILSRLGRSQQRQPIDCRLSMTNAITSMVEETSARVMAAGPTSLPTQLTDNADKIRPPSLPTAWAFFTSGYMIGLLLVAFILHRMQNVILPSRTPAGRRRDYILSVNTRTDGFFGRRFNFLRNIMLRRIYAALLPLDITKSTTRLAIQLPSICLLTKMLVLWCLLVLQTCDMIPDWAWFQRLGAWSEKKEMSEICWSTFCAVGCAFCVEGFIRALDGMSTTFAFGGHSNPNASPFNLIGYAFLLHIYSSPTTHLYRPLEGLPSRPDKHVIVTIAIPLLQLTIFHYLSISKRLSSHRLLPTTLTSLLSLVHFHMTIYHKYLLPANPISAATTVTATQPTATASLPIPSATNTRAYSPSGFPSSYDFGLNYPLLNYIPNMFETALLSTILLTIGLNVTVQLLVRGRVERPFIGLGLNNGSADDRQPTTWTTTLRNLPWDEDFGVLLLRMTTASLEATGLRGWGNEVAPVPAPLRTPSLSSARRPPRATQEAQYGRVKVGKTGVESLIPGLHAKPYSLGSSYMADASSTQHVTRRRTRKDERTRRIKPLEGYQNEVRTVDVGIHDDESINEERQGRRIFIQRRWLRAFGTFARVLWGTLRGACCWLCFTSRNILCQQQSRVAATVDAQEKERLSRIVTGVPFNPFIENDDEESSDADEREAIDDPYTRFLRGDVFSDDDSDDSYSDCSDSSDSELELSSTDVEGSPCQDDTSVLEVSMWEKVKEEAMHLFSDLVDEIDGDPSAFLAHAAYPRSSGPLTRRRVNSALRAQRQQSTESEDQEECARREVNQKWADSADEGENMRRLCVICTVEERDIICWPCRCLAMCDNCRDVMSSRSAPSKHRCPCCRRRSVLCMC
ncbi:hypothetical protein JOM56_003208 [Amanita muscaria]